MNKKDDQIFFKYTQGVKPINRKNRIKKGIKLLDEIVMIDGKEVAEIPPFMP